MKTFVGKVVTTHGVKGEIKIKSDFERKNLVFKKGNNIYIDEEQFLITNYRVHKGYDMITMDGISNLNQVIELKGKNVYIEYKDLGLNENEYIYSELIGYEVYCDKIIGKVYDYSNTLNPLLYVSYCDKTYYIPLRGDFIKLVDKKKQQIIVTEATKELIL